MKKTIRTLREQMFFILKMVDHQWKDYKIMKGEEVNEYVAKEFADRIIQNKLKPEESFLQSYVDELSELDEAIYLLKRYAELDINEEKK